MNIQGIQQKLAAKSIFLNDGNICGRPAVIGYEKKFRWAWFATQLNTFVIAVDFGAETISEEAIESVLTESFACAKQNYRGWPRGLQSALAVVAILVSEDVDEAAAQYCTELRSGKKWAGFSVPVAVDSKSGEVHVFAKNPMWGRIYYPHLKKLIVEVTS